MSVLQKVLRGTARRAGLFHQRRTAAHRAAAPLTLALTLVLAAPCFAQTAPPAAPAAPYGASTPATSEGSSVQLYGILDAGVRHVDQASKAGAVTQFASGLNTSRFGLRGNEIIDTDLRAFFRLEDGFNPGTGAQSNSGALFDRTAMVGLGWRNWDLKLGRQEGFGYELAASGATDPLAMALNLPNPASPAAAGSKAPVLGANPLQGLYSYTYGQLRFNNAVRVSTNHADWSAGLFYAFGGVSGSSTADSVRAGHLGIVLGPTHWEGIFQQAIDLKGEHSSLGVLAGTWDIDPWKFQAGLHDVRIDAGFDATGLGNGASGTGILGSSTTVSTALAGVHQDFRFTIADLGATWSVTPTTPVTLAAYKTRSQGAGDGNSVALVALGKWYLSRRTALYLEADHAVSSGTLATKTLTGGASELAFMTGVNVRF
jgi:predicted porin